ncbi:MAG: MATE family efflux transporter [Pseudobutyrivibrio sp.]|nr:MATE family efflux transporter [Pseudobutyrivibrio sp.]
MTTGNPIKLILQFSLPVLLGNILQQLYNLADGVIVGQILGAEALGAVGATTSVQFLVMGFCIGICTGFAIPVAKEFGAGSESSMRHYIYNAGILTAFFAILMTGLTVVLCKQILILLQVPDSMFADAYSYLVIIFAGIPFTMLYNLLAGFLRAVGDSRTPFMFLIISTFLNILGDILCIVVFHMGCAGAGIATVVAQIISGFLCLMLIIKKYTVLHIQPSERHFKSNTAKRLVIMGVPLGLQFSITAIGSMVMQTANNSLGNLYVSAFAASMKIKQFALCPYDAIGTAVSMFAGQNLGAGKFDRVKTGIKTGVLIALCYGLLAGTIMNVFGHDLLYLFIQRGQDAVADTGYKYIYYLSFFYWCLGLLIVCRMSIQGLGHASRTLISGAIEMVARIIVCTFFVTYYGFTAICFADQCAWIFATLYCGIVLIKIVKDLPNKMNPIQA